ncbi:MAG: MBL fold metallo-hydrolase [Oscillospiraceae bacterium]|nr:MBL fold metallo-hydrolase [Oscillospiraceae bacterium]
MLPSLVTLTNPLFKSNCYILYQNGHAIVIDPSSTDELLHLLTQNKLTLDKILLTHEHYDHIAGITALRAAYPHAPVAACAACAQRMVDPYYNHSSSFDVYLYFLNGERPAVPTPPFYPAKPTVIIPPSYKENWQDYVLTFQQTPGHSPAGICILLEHNSLSAQAPLLFSGDSLLPSGKPYLGFNGHSEADYRAVTLPWLRSLPANTQVYSGHGQPFLLGEKLLELFA